MTDIPRNKIIRGDCMKVMRDWPQKSVQCCVTSPPYWGLRDYGVDGQLGLEKTPEEYVAKMVEVFREVKRVLRDDGTLWLNLGDSYAQSHGSGPLKPKDLCGIPWRVAFALQADGWYLRQDIIWHKPNPMPESVGDRCTKAHEYLFLLTLQPRYFYDAAAIYEPCSLNTNMRVSQDVANQIGSARAHAGGKTNGPMKAVINPGRKIAPAGSGIKQNDSFESAVCLPVQARNKRSVWTVTTKGFPDAHFATFPAKLIEPCILAGTSTNGACPECGGAWERVVEKGRSLWEERKAEGEPMRSGEHSRSSVNSKMDGKRQNEWKREHPDKTLGWRPTCDCGCEKREPCVVLDPFMGSGTVAEVAVRLKRDYAGIELSPEYAAMARERLKAVETGVPVDEARAGQMAMEFDREKP